MRPAGWSEAAISSARCCAEQTIRMSEGDDIISYQQDGVTEAARHLDAIEKAQKAVDEFKQWRATADAYRVTLKRGIRRSLLSLLLCLVFYGLMFVTITVSIPEADWVAAGIFLIVGIGIVYLVEICALRLGAERRVLELLDFPFEFLVTLGLAYWWYSADPLAAIMLPWYVALACVCVAHQIFAGRKRVADQRDAVIKATYNSETRAREAREVETRDKEAARAPDRARRALERGRELDWAEKEAADLLAEYNKPDMPCGDGSPLTLEAQENLLQEKYDRLSTRLLALDIPHDAELWTDEEERRVIRICDQRTKLYDYSEALWERIMTISEKRDPEIWGGWRQEKARRISEPKRQRAKHGGE